MCLKQAAIRTDSVYEPKCVLLKLDIVIETSMTVLASNISGILIHLQKISRILKIWKSRMIYRKETTDINNSKKLYLIPVTVKLNTISWCWKMGGGGWRIWAFHVKSMALHADIIFFFISGSSNNFHQSSSNRILESVPLLTIFILSPALPKPTLNCHSINAFGVNV